MFNKKEILLISIMSLILALALSFLKGMETFLYSLLLIFLILIINLSAKKISSFYLDSKIEIKPWAIKRYGFKPSRHFKQPFPAGVLFPLLSSFFTLGNFTWLGALVFETKPRVYRAAKRHALYNFSAITEDHIGFIAASGIIANLAFALLGYLIGFTDFAALNVYYAFFNILPVSDLDGNKIFFGSLKLWGFLATITFIAVGAIIFLA
jgi:hypothetical protein